MRALIIVLASCATGSSPVPAVSPPGPPPASVAPPPGSPLGAVTTPVIATVAPPRCRIDIDGRQRIRVDGWETRLATPRDAHVSTFATGDRLLFGGDAHHLVIAFSDHTVESTDGKTWKPTSRGLAPHRGGPVAVRGATYHPTATGIVRVRAGQPPVHLQLPR